MHIPKQIDLGFADDDHAAPVAQNFQRLFGGAVARRRGGDRKACLDRWLWNRPAVLAASARATAPPNRRWKFCATGPRGRRRQNQGDLPWEYAFGKEIEVRFSRSYGPGRTTLPTSGRARTIPSDMFAGPSSVTSRWVCMMRTGDLNIAALPTRRAPFTQALQVYQQPDGRRRG